MQLHLCRIDTWFTHTYPQVEGTSSPLRSGYVPQGCRRQGQGERRTSGLIECDVLLVNGLNALELLGMDAGLGYGWKWL